LPSLGLEIEMPNVVVVRYSHSRMAFEPVEEGTPSSLIAETVGRTPGASNGPSFRVTVSNADMQSQSQKTLIDALGTQQVLSRQYFARHADGFRATMEAWVEFYKLVDQVGPTEFELQGKSAFLEAKSAPLRAQRALLEEEGKWESTELRIKDKATRLPNGLGIVGVSTGPLPYDVEVHNIVRDALGLFRESINEACGLSNVAGNKLVPFEAIRDLYNGKLLKKKTLNGLPSRAQWLALLELRSMHRDDSQFYLMCNIGDMTVFAGEGVSVRTTFSTSLVGPEGLAALESRDRR
jgi:hypothetical protein